MSPRALEPLCEPVLIEVGLSHGFGQIGSGVPEGTVFPKQVHGTDVLEAESPSRTESSEADAVITSRPGVSVGIVTADCVPILAASVEGRCQPQVTL